jgi:hypothetical protein
MLFGIMTYHQVLANDWIILDISCFLSILCDWKHHGNAKVNFILYVSVLEANEQHRKNMKHVEIT